MAVFQAFRALRPTKEKASAVAALPYDVVSRQEAKEIGEKNLCSFLHVDRAEMDLEPGTDLYAPAVYEKAAQNLRSMEEKGILVQEEKPCFYIYEQTRQGKTQTGLAGCCSIDDYLDGTIKKHELTRADKEQDRICHVDVCDANTGPIFLAARYSQELREFLQDWKCRQEPVYDFVSEDGVGHRVWVIGEEEACSFIRKEFAGMSSLYIADGHHRAASAVKVGLKKERSA